MPELEVDFLPVNPRLSGPLRHLQRVKYMRTVATSAAYTWQLAQKLGSFDVVHAFSASYWSFLLAPVPAMVGGRLAGCGVILNYRSGEADDHLARGRLLSKRLMRLAHRIVVPSGYLVDVFARHGFRATPIPNFVDADSIPFRDRSLLRPIFLSNRNLEPMYNVACTVRAFARVQRTLGDARLIVAGDGRERVALESQVRDLGLRNVEFRGRVRPGDMARLYDEADVYLNSPDIDNMPNSILEAFAAGLPVVTTDAGGIPYIATDGVNARVVRRDDDEALASAALSLIGDPLLAMRLAASARAECLTKYAWDAVSRAWSAVYREVAEQARRPRLSGGRERSATEAPARD